MRLIILNQFFYPDHSATSQLMTDLAESLVEKGLAVTAIAGRGRYDGGARLAASESHKGVRIERAWATGFGKGSMAGRLADYLSFYLGATWKLLRQPHHDIVMALTTPPLIGLVALLIARLRGMRFVALVQDLYPDVAVALGALNANHLLARTFDKLNRYLLRHADRVIVLSECMRDRVLAKLDSASESHIDVIHNWADGTTIEPLEKAGDGFRAEHNLQDRFIVLFSGNWGLVNEFQTVLEAARILRERRDIVFAFIGNGARAGEIRAYCEDHRLENIRLLPYQPRERLRATLTSADVGLVTLAPGLAGLSVPSKTYGLMAAGRPILFVGDTSSEIAKIISEADCGAALPSGKGAELARLIGNWSCDPTRLGELGRRARVVFDSRFDRSIAVDSYIQVFEKTLKLSTLPVRGLNEERNLSSRDSSIDSNGTRGFGAEKGKKIKVGEEIEPHPSLNR